MGLDGGSGTSSSLSISSEAVVPFLRVEVTQFRQSESTSVRLNRRGLKRSDGLDRSTVGGTDW